MLFCCYNWLFLCIDSVACLVLWLVRFVKFILLVGYLILVCCLDVYLLRCCLYCLWLFCLWFWHVCCLFIVFGCLFRVLLLRVKVFDNSVDWFFVSLDGLIAVLNYGGCLLWLLCWLCCYACRWLLTLLIVVCLLVTLGLMVLCSCV